MKPLELFRYYFPGAGTLASVAVSALGLAACSNAETPETQAPRTVIVETVTAQRVAAAAAVPGVLRAVERSLLSLETQGRILSVHVDLGDQFKKGDILAQLVSDVQFATLAARHADETQATALLAEAQVKFSRQTQLRKAGHVSAAALDTARARRDSAAAALSAAKAQVTVAQTLLAQTMIRAPYDGKVTGRFSEPGEIVTPQDPVLSVIGLSQSFEAVLNLPALHRSQIVIGQRLEVRIVGTQRVTTASVREIGTQANQTGLFPVVADVEQPLPNILPGQTIEARIMEELEPDSIFIPLSAFGRDAEANTFVFVLNEKDDALRKTPVSIGAILNKRIAVLEGISPGDRIVVRGVDLLHDGQRIAVQDRAAGRQRYLQ